jgi:glycosyltransferase involved in cell wall biosynthesis
VVVPPGDVATLAASLDELLSDAERRAALGEGARARCEERYSWNAMERILEQELTRVTAG